MTCSARQVPEEELREYAESIGASWVETSAKENINVGACLKTPKFVGDMVDLYFRQGV